MATVRISQLTAITTPTDDDVLIINDADTNTRKITFANLTQGLLNSSGTSQTKSGALTVDGTLTAGANFVVDTDTLYVDATNNRVGIRTNTPASALDIDGEIRVRNANSLTLRDANNSNGIGLRAPSVVPADYQLTLPSALPADTNLLVADVGGAISYTDQVRYNSSAGALEANQLRLPNQGLLRFYENNSNGSNYIQFNAPANIATSNTYTLPTTYPGTAGFVLSSDLTGNLSWVSNSAAAAGSPGEIQFNGGAGLSADAQLSWDAGTNTLNTQNATLTGTLTVNGDVNLGDATTDEITFTGRANSDLIPVADGSYDLGTSLLRWGEVHAADLYTYGDTSIGDDSTDTVTVTATITSDLLPTTGSYDLGGTSNLWAEVHTNNVYVGSGEIVHNGYARQTVYANGTVVTATSFDVNLGDESAYAGYKLIIVARDNVTGDIESYEHLIVQDGAGGISEVSGSNVQAPTPGTFLTTPLTAIVGTDVVCSITNSAVSTNPVSITVQATAIALL